MADLSIIWKRLYRYKTTHPDVDRSFTSWFSSQMDIRKFAFFVFLLNLGILPLTVKGMPVSSFHRRPLQSAFVRSYT